LNKPWTDGYRFCGSENQWLETPKICVMLSPMRAALLAKFLVCFGRTVTFDEIHEMFHGSDEDGGPLAFSNVTAVQISGIRRQLKQYGIKVDIRSCYNVGYALVGLDECEPKLGEFRERMTRSITGKRRFPMPNEEKIVPMRYTNGKKRSGAAITAPRKYGYVYEVNEPPKTRFCQDVPWARHAREEHCEQMSLAKIARPLEKRRTS
jgi:hypothetical protein